MHRVLFTVAGLLSAALTISNAAIYIFFVDLSHPNLQALLVWGPSIASLPLFLVALGSRKWHALAMWVLAFASFCSTYATIPERNSSGSVVAVAIHAFRFLPVVFAVLIAILVECSFRLRRAVPRPGNRTMM